MPRFDGLPVERYWCPDARRSPLVTVATSRGCPHRCAFCGSPALWKRRVLYVPIPTVLAWLEEQVERHGIREVSFVDDCFTLNRARTLELCRGMVSRGLDLSWFCNARATEVDQEVGEAMAASGCHQVYLGFESGSQGILDSVQKDTKIEDLVRGAEILKDAGISRSVGFIVGLPGETDETVAETAALAHRVKPERIQFSRFTPVHGSTLGEAGAPGARDFHSMAEDRVGEWVKRLYAECQGRGWGRASW